MDFLSTSTKSMKTQLAIADAASWYCGIVLLCLLLLCADNSSSDASDAVSVRGNQLSNNRPCDEIYVVGEGETLHTISDKCGDPYIVEQNPHIHDPDDVFPGLVIKITPHPHTRDGQAAPLRDGGERGRTGIRHFLRKDDQNLWQVFSDRSPGDGSQNGFSGLSASADMTGEQDGVGEDLLSQVRTLQDSAPGLLGCLELAFELLDPLVPLSKGLLEGRHLSTVYFVPVFGPGEEIGDRVGHLQGYGLAVEVDNTNAE
nr:Spore coat assembly protein like [Ipomoea batatas]